jgi:hypothetical protein
MESCQNHFWGTLNTPPPQKNPFSSKNKRFLEKESLWLLNSRLQENVFNHANLFGGAIFMFPPFNPPNPVSSRRQRTPPTRAEVEGVCVCVFLASRGMGVLGAPRFPSLVVWGHFRLRQQKVRHWTSKEIALNTNVQAYLVF